MLKALQQFPVQAQDVKARLATHSCRLRLLPVARETGNSAFQRIS